MIEFKLPSLGAEMDEGTLLEWRVKPGDQVRKGDVVALIDTTKSAIEVEIWEAGTIWELVHQPPETLAVGTVIARLLEPGETPEQAAAAKARLTAAAAAAAAPVDAGALPPLAGTAPVPAAAPTESRHRVTPVARRRAAELALDLSTVTGTGPQGAITLEDVEQAALALAQPKDRAGEMRRAIAAAMARSKREIPHYYLSEDLPLVRATEWLAAHNEGRAITERVLLAVLQLKAVALALKKYPDLNGYYRDDAFVPGSGIHLGVAISLRQGGLIAPAIRDVDQLGVDELMRTLTDLVTRARALTLRSSEMSDATATVTNLGEQGVARVYGVIYPPQVALIGFGKVTDRPWVADGGLVVAPVVTASLAADHRASDGHRGGLFLAEVARLLQEPEQLVPGAG